MITLTGMTALVRALVDANDDVDKAEQALKEAKERARIIREETIPCAMQEIGLQSMVLDTGQKLKIAQEVYASIPAENKPLAYKWLNDNNFGGLIKIRVVTDFGKGEQAQALDLYNELVGRGLQSVAGEDVHAQTLKAFLKSELAKGTSIPLELFGARPVWTAKISDK